jgi:hypothetical protein
MSPKQTHFYFTLWNRVCVENGWYHLGTTEKNARRHALHIQARCTKPDGSSKSSRHFTNQDFDRFKALCLHLLGDKKSGGTDKEEDDGLRRRLVWRIKDDARKAGLEAAYIIEVARDLNVLGNWEDLSTPDLENLRNTIHNRAGKKLGADTRNVVHRRRYTLQLPPADLAPATVQDPF